MAAEFAPNFVNALAFIGLTISTYTVFYFGRVSAKDKGVSFSLFTLALGLNLIGLSHLFRVWPELISSPLVSITTGIGSVFLTIGVAWVFYESKTELIVLRKRQEDIKTVISKLKEKYYQQELSEEDLKTAHSQLLKELAEIEVDISGKSK